MINKRCKICGMECPNRRSYCCPEHQLEGRQRTVNTKSRSFCRNCDGDIPKHKQIFCSDQCRKDYYFTIKQNEKRKKLNMPTL